MSNEEIRVVLLKPGDTLLIGNVGDRAIEPEVVAAAQRFFRAVGVNVVLFDGDIRLAQLPTGSRVVSAAGGSGGGYGFGGASLGVGGGTVTMGTGRPHHPLLPSRAGGEREPESSATTLTVTDSVKMLRETFCVAQVQVGHSGLPRSDEHVARLERLIAECDRHRPLGPDGKHGDRHTPTCGCDLEDR